MGVEGGRGRKINRREKRRKEGNGEWGREERTSRRVDILSNNCTGYRFVLYGVCVWFCSVTQRLSVPSLYGFFFVVPTAWSMFAAWPTDPHSLSGQVKYYYPPSFKFLMTETKIYLKLKFLEKPLVLLPCLLPFLKLDFGLLPGFGFQNS